tara:strand:+ start:9052 stop:10122 length:1071 start_codon:yes stop_codon:yes gene_type:complete
MNLKKNTRFNYFFMLCIISPLIGNGIWVKYGWELFEHVTNARIAGLGNATTAYAMPTSASTVVNPFFVYQFKDNIELTHQSRFAGLVNSDILSGQFIVKNKSRMQFNLLYEGIGSIPDTRDALMDWGLDGVFGTNDTGEGNGVIDDGERLNKNQISYFSQQQLGIHCALLKQIKQFSLGLGIKVLSYSIGEHYGLGFGLDIGTVKKVSNLNIGFVLRNLPSSGLIWDHGKLEATAPTLALGLHSPYSLKMLGIELHSMMNMEFSLNNLNLDSQIRIGKAAFDTSFGFEIIAKNMLFLRLGKNQLGNMTGGLGLSWIDFGIDYAFLISDIDSNLGNHHLLTLRVSLHWIRSMILDPR